MKINLKGAIVSNDEKWIYDLFEIQAVCPKDIATALAEAAGADVVLEVNSGGGEVFAANEIYYLLNQYQGQVTADIIGLAGSAATIICCGANMVRAVPSAMYMIHNVSCLAAGDYHEMDRASEKLQNVNKAIATAYMQKTGMSEEELLKLMDNESWFGAAKAKELGFIDEVIGENETAIYNAQSGGLLSPEMKEKAKMQAKIKLLKLKGGLRNEI